MLLSIALGKSRKTKVWKNSQMLWADLVKKLSSTERTHETIKEYLAWGKTKEGKEKQSIVKDHGGYLGGYLKNGHRSPSTVDFRQVLTLDLDFANKYFWDDFCMLYDCEAVMHTTHKHTEESPRFRLIIPLSTKVSKEEYEAIGRRVADIIDISLFDTTTFQPERLMYWPTTSKDGEWIFEHQKGDFLDPGKILRTYINPLDISEWPRHENEDAEIREFIDKQGIPSEKPGLIGAFCRTFNIHDAISLYLGNEYTQTAQDDRYTYAKGSAASGAIVYNDEFLYSHHGTDPAHNKLLNSFDLVRIHKFGYEDGETEEKDITKRKSYKSMLQFAGAVKEVVAELGAKNLAADDFDEYEEDEAEELAAEKTPEQKEWLGKMEVTEAGAYKNTINNFYLVLENDPKLKGRLKYNEFSHRECARGPLPWAARKKKEFFDFTDSDDASLRHYVERRYKMYNVSKSRDAMTAVFKAHCFHPIREYINSLTWDGEKRLETLLVDFLGAEDSSYVRGATRKAIVAAVARVFTPGVKFDYALTLIGPQGIKKSMFPDKLGKQWYSDSLTTVVGTEAYEQLQGVWIMEMAELSAVNKAEFEAAKHFITKRTDSFRVAYGRRKEDFPRQTIFIATSNIYELFKDPTGNRRFWPVKVTGLGISDMDDLPVDQIWAEAKVCYDAGEQLYFDIVAEQDAKSAQTEHTQTDDRTGMIFDYLEMLLPSDWETRDIFKRRNYIHSPDELSAKGENKRFVVSVAEIWTELFKGEIKDMGQHNTKFLHSLLTNMPGWERSDSFLDFGHYGRQRAYLRKGETIRSIVIRRGRKKA